MHERLYLPLLMAVSVFLFSCEKEEDIPPIDYSIDSTSNLEIISQHPNGWIQQARILIAGEPAEEFEYYENGYIKSAKLYTSYPEHYLYMEVSRSEDNQPQWSKYYNSDGEVWFKTEYTNGLPAVKTVFSEEGTTSYNYINGTLSTIEFTASDNSSTSTTSFNAEAETRNVTIVKDGQSILDKTYPYKEQVGAGIYTSNFMPVANPFGTPETSYYKLNQSFSQSPTWRNDADPIAFMYPYRLFDEFYSPGYYFATKFAVNTELYQSVIEQYPVTEKGVLIGGGSYQDGYDYQSTNWKVRDSLRTVYEENPDLYKLKYGNEYVEKIGYGKVFLVIGALRNMPTSTEAADNIKRIAYKRMNELLNGGTGLNPEEQEILNKVWFEIKFFSSLDIHRNGVVIDSATDYEDAMKQLNDSELSVIQLQYQTVKNL